MPVYEYRCMRCGQIFDKYSTVDNRHQASCPKCSGEGRVKINSSPVHFKGGGFTGARKDG